jgi:hypothetical protein
MCALYDLSRITEARISHQFALQQIVLSWCGHNLGVPHVLQNPNYRFSCRLHAFRIRTDRAGTPEDYGDFASSRLHVESRGDRSLLQEIIGAVKEPDPENAKGVRYAVSATQFIEVLPLPADAGINRLDHTAWNTTNAEANARISGGERLEHTGQGDEGFRRQPLV